MGKTGNIPGRVGQGGGPREVHGGVLKGKGVGKRTVTCWMKGGYHRGGGGGCSLGGALGERPFPIERENCGVGGHGRKKGSRS